MSVSSSDSMLINRFRELAGSAFAHNCWKYTEFLTIAEQDMLQRAVDKGTQYELWGGFEGADRRIAFFGSEDDFGYSRPDIISCVQIKPVSKKFADNLSHRDFLGALMSLGIRREVLGDILVQDNCGYLFCLESIAGYIIENCTKARHTTLKCCVTDTPPLSAVEEPPESRIVISSERMDAIVAAVYGLSRSESQKLFSEQKVFRDSRICENGADKPRDRAVISVRGFGKFIYCGVERETKKGRLSANIRKYC